MMLLKRKKTVLIWGEVMNNNICKWGVEHRLTLIRARIKLTQKIVAKILASLVVFYTGITFPLQNTAYASDNLAGTGYTLSGNNSLSMVQNGNENRDEEKLKISQTKSNTFAFGSAATREEELVQLHNEVLSLRAEAQKLLLKDSAPVSGFF